MSAKIKSIPEMAQIIAEQKVSGVHFVHCHGVFDLVHPGHLHHFEEAKAHGDKLIVSITPDCFVNKGPGRPFFTEQARLKQLAALACIDYVVLNDAPEATPLIERLKAQHYAKGEEYSDPRKDITQKISEESAAVEAIGGKVIYTGGEVFSSSELLNRFMDEEAQRLAPFMQKIADQFGVSAITDLVESFRDRTVVLYGDAILDEYQYVQPLGQSGKGHHICATLCEAEMYLGGALIMANHLASFVKEVILVTAVGKECPHTPWIQQMLAPNVRTHFLYHGLPTLKKRRYVFKDGAYLDKMFETYSHNTPLLDTEQTAEAIAALECYTSQASLVCVSDFGNGFTNPSLVAALSQTPCFLAVNTQTNSGNRGFNVVTHYGRADFIALNEPEVRLAAHDSRNSLESVCHRLAYTMSCPLMAVTRGTRGALMIQQEETWELPVLTTQAVDRVGAGDSFFALASLAAAQNAHPLLVGLLGSTAASMKVHVVGNKVATERVPFLKYITRLFK